MHNFYEGNFFIVRYKVQMHCTLIFVLFYYLGFWQMYLTQHFLSCLFWCRHVHMRTSCNDEFLQTFFFFYVLLEDHFLFGKHAVYRNFSCCSNLYCLTIWQICCSVLSRQ
ncbi:unnamed protein product [Ixodes pacificus]